ncbi:hypothetical protein KO481_21260 [Nocardia sp. NEAU-G5]|uniref:Uncharacterized protein n=1 Tax=Nocardia albiluteola TaxID=2842303 RepID=A0ABS6B183_9NOCA|nr:hypothetical protein [Nocardia albiluteola]MBU3064047.1 hypothetical protein [Nocardia albiluteola]
MVVLRNLVRIAGAVTVSAALTCAGASTVVAAPPPAPAVDPVAAGSDPSALAAGALAALAAGWRTDAAQSDALDAYQRAVDGLQRFGIEPFLYPSAAAFCRQGTTMGLVPAIAGAVPGPWPKTTVQVPGVDLSAVKSGQTMFAFVPYGVGPDGADTSGMQVLWFNAATGRGGLAPMGTLTQVATAMVPAQVPEEMRPLAREAIQNFLVASLPLGGVRAVPVDTGSGTVLAAVFGTVRNGNRDCFFLPTVGVTEVR